MDEVNRNIEKSGLEPSVYFFENRCGSYGDFLAFLLWEYLARLEKQVKCLARGKKRC